MEHEGWRSADTHTLIHAHAQQPREKTSEDDQALENKRVREEPQALLKVEAKEVFECSNTYS